MSFEVYVCMLGTSKVSFKDDQSAEMQHGFWENKRRKIHDGCLGVLIGCVCVFWTCTFVALCVLCACEGLNEEV